MSEVNIQTFSGLTESCHIYFYLHTRVLLNDLQNYLVGRAQNLMMNEVIFYVYILKRAIPNHPSFLEGLMTRHQVSMTSF